MKKFILLTILFPILIATEPKAPIEISIAKPLDFVQIDTENEQLKQQRQDENAARTKKWLQDDANNAEKRNKEKWTTRIYNSLWHDQEVDLNFQSQRNKEILDVNKRRLNEDFEIQKKHFDAFKQKYPDLSKNPPFNTLLEFGDMNKFVNMTYADRKAFIEKLRDATSSERLSSIKITEEDKPALDDLMKLAMPHLEVPKRKQILRTVQQDLALSNSDPEKIKEALLETLPDSLAFIIQKLEDFNEHTENLTSEIASLERTRIIKQISLYAMFAIGAVATILTLAHTAIIVGPIVLTVGMLSILGQANMYAYYMLPGQEAALALELQNKFKNQFETLLPNTSATLLLKAQEYKDTSQGLTGRVRNKLETALGKDAKIFSMYDTSKQAITDFADKAAAKINKLKEYVKLKFNSTPTRKTVTDEQRQEFSLAGPTATTLPAV